MKRIPRTCTKILRKDDKLANRVARRNPKIYYGKYDAIELEEWIRGMKKVFTSIKVPEDKRGEHWDVLPNWQSRYSVKHH